MAAAEAGSIVTDTSSPSRRIMTVNEPTPAQTYSNVTAG
jgi:hypothetical protein